MEALETGALLAPFPDRPAPPSAHDCAAATDAAREAVVRLSRAVQRAAIYPADHPAVRLALGPFVELLDQLAQAQRRLLFVVMRDRIVASAGEEVPREHRSRWLASQLYGRRITSLTFESRVDVEELQGFVQWLAVSVREQGAALVPPTGIRVTQLDYSRAQFEEAPRARGNEPPEAVAAWNALAVGLLLPGATLSRADGADATTPLDPAEVANAIESDLAAAEGTGVSALTGRLIRAGGGLATLGETERQVVREKLAAVVAGLTPDIRRQMLTVVPDDNPGKLDLLIEIVDALPRERLLELVPRVDMTPGTHARQFLAFLIKLVSLAGHDPVVGEAMDTQLSRHGLPAELLHVDTEGAQALLDRLFSETVEHFSTTSDLYRSSLQELSTKDLTTTPALDLTSYGDLEDADEAARRVSQIALRLLRSDVGDGSAAACLIRARDVARRELEAGAIDLLAELASIAPLLRVSLDTGTQRLVHECHALCREPRTAERLMVALEAEVGPAGESLTALFLAAGLPAATRAIERIGELRDGPLRDRLGHLVARLDLDVIRPAIAQACARGGSVSGLLGVFRQIDPARTAHLARLFIRDHDPLVRRQALEVLSDAPVAPVKRERVMLLALTDPDPSVVRVALRELSAHQSPPALTALTGFLSGTPSAAFEPLQRYAVQALRVAWTPKVTDALARALLARRHAFDLPARRVSCAIVAVLESAGGDRAHGAVRAWRRSPAGVWNACRGNRGGASS